ncbi:hypothetical protein GQ42DRAFT_160421 [Ramicandelaber brevisporus]|nr:hypothetical protein GQ42DRAFT_160421 [Ramicandelaber brevisporus]
MKLFGFILLLAFVIFALFGDSIVVANANAEADPSKIRGILAAGVNYLRNNPVQRQNFVGALRNVVQGWVNRRKAQNNA